MVAFGCVEVGDASGYGASRVRRRVLVDGEVEATRQAVSEDTNGNKMRSYLRVKVKREADTCLVSGDIVSEEEVAITVPQLLPDPAVHDVLE